MKKFQRFFRDMLRKLNLILKKRTLIKKIMTASLIQLSGKKNFDYCIYI